MESLPVASLLGDDGGGLGQAAQEQVQIRFDHSAMRRVWHGFATRVLHWLETGATNGQGFGQAPDMARVAADLIEQSAKQ